SWFPDAEKIDMPPWSVLGSDRLVESGPAAAHKSRAQSRLAFGPVAGVPVERDQTPLPPNPVRLAYALAMPPPRRQLRIIAAALPAPEHIRISASLMRFARAWHPDDLVPAFVPPRSNSRRDNRFHGTAAYRQTFPTAAVHRCSILPSPPGAVPPLAIKH